MCPLDMGTESVEVMEAERIIIPVNDLAIMLTNTTGQHSLIVYNRELHQVRLEKIEDAPPPPHQIEIIMQSPLEATEGQAVNSDVRDPNLTTSERMPAEADIKNFTSVIEELISKLDSIVDPSGRSNADYSRWIEVHKKVEFLEKALAAECRRAAHLEDEMETIDEEHTEELQYLDEERKKDQEEISSLETKLKQMENTQEERTKLAKELDLLKLKFRTNLNIFKKLQHLNAMGLVNRLHDASKDTLFLTTCVKQLSSAPNEMLTVQPLTSSVVSEAIKEVQEAAVQAAVQASPPQTPPPVNERKIKKSSNLVVILSK
ncbi:uncharacterized protein LOC118439402 [Folsomia candida]|uniref:uncharacterized protein LOC118439402 n=1 Tax=Folsomia candida TaxID=158441 RepID=UPI0016051150|nr:uncharacterized protein LOC118439402 [Folsomia candida]